jgi:hypothetical protein
MPTPETIALHLENVPEKFRKLTARALRGECRSPRAAIRAKCLECSNYSTGEAAACTVWRCPLHAINPYRHAAEATE